MSTFELPDIEDLIVSGNVASFTPFWETSIPFKEPTHKWRGPFIKGVRDPSRREEELRTQLLARRWK